MKKVKYMALVLVLVLGLVGAGYAAWEQDLLIDAQVETGYLEVYFDGEDYDDGDCDYGETEVGTHSHEGVSDANLRIRIDNSYPQYESTVMADVENEGTIPVKVDFEEVGVPWQLDVTTEWDQGEQLDPGESEEIEVVIEATEDVEQDTEYSFDIVLTATQWNKHIEPGYKSIPTTNTEAQYEDLLATQLSDPFEIEVKVLEDGDQFTGEITANDHDNTEFFWVTNHLGEYDETPEDRYGAYFEMDFDEEGYATILAGNAADVDVNYRGMDVNAVTEGIEFNFDEIGLDDLEVDEMIVQVEQ